MSLLEQICVFTRCKLKKILSCFLLRYVPNVVKRSTWQQCIYWWPSNPRPTSHLGKFRMAIFLQWVIRSMFGSGVGLWQCCLCNCADILWRCCLCNCADRLWRCWNACHRSSHAASGSARSPELPSCWFSIFTRNLAVGRRPSRSPPVNDYSRGPLSQSADFPTATTSASYLSNFIVSCIVTCW